QDIKPDNILIDESGDFLLTDFGISRQMQSTLKKATANQSYMTVAYSPPERFIADPVDAPAGDIFSLGVTLYELCTGNLPWDGAGGMILNTGAQVPNLPEAYSGRLNKIVKACMDVDYTKRPTAGQLVSLARGFLKESYWGEVVAKDVAAVKPIGRKTQKKPENGALGLTNDGISDQAKTITDFSAVTPESSLESPAEKMASQLLQQGVQKISTIKKIKEQFGLSLSEAKSIVDRVDPDYKAPEIESHKRYRKEPERSLKSNNQLFTIKESDSDWTVALKKSGDLTLKFTGGLFTFIGLAIWLGSGSIREFIEFWPLFLFANSALFPVIVAWYRVSQRRMFKDVVIALLTTLLWPAILSLMIGVLFFGIDTSQ
ncbi:MAG: protein kinase, partial [Balneolaceae bacterium]|nr:protein kinase [Balneolaceae bacterium]